MHKLVSRVSVFACAGLMALCLLLPAAHASEALETDQDIFQMCLEAAQYTMPGGYEMEGFLRADVNEDAITDALCILRHENGSRMFVTFISGGEGYIISESTRALPAQGSADGDTDTFGGMTLVQGGVVLYMRGSNGQRYESEYTFMEANGRFYLRSLVSLLWEEETGQAIQNRFDFVTGEHSKTTGQVRQGAFSPDGSDELNLFTKNAYGTDIEAFDMEGFPVTWESFSVVTGDGASAKCDLCGEMFESEADRLAHQCKESAGMIYCDVCGGMFEEGEAFRDHPCEEPENALKCPACDAVLSGEQTLLEHQCPAATAQPPKKTITCTVCEGVFEEGYEFRNHLCVSYPSEEGLVYCDICEKSFPEGEAFRTHECKQP